MRLALRFIIPLFVVLTLFAYAMVPLVDGLINKWFIRDLDIRTVLITNSVQENLAALVKLDSKPKIQNLFNNLIEDERLYAVGFFDSSGTMKWKTSTFPSDIRIPDANASEKESPVLNPTHGSLHVSFNRIEDN